MWKASPEVEIRFGRPALMPHTARRLADETAYPVCAPGSEPSMRDWRTAPLFDCAGVTTNWDAWLTSQGHALAPDRSVHFASTYVVVMTAAMNGAGLSMAHDTLASGLLADGRLERTCDHGVAMPEGYFLLPPAKHEETPASRAFIDWIEEPFVRRG